MPIIHSQQAAAPTEKETAKSQLPPTLLYIEDNALNFRLIELVLEGQRPLIKLLGANRGRSGIASAVEHQPDLILLDLQLPDLGGGEVLEQLQKDPRTAAIPVVMISADATAAQIERILALGARNYLTKPLSLTQLLSVIDEILPAANVPQKPAP
jgi:CheY-like chemotaxis protein